MMNQHTVPSQLAGDQSKAPSRDEVKTHDLKIWPGHYEQLIGSPHGGKAFEIRYNDRDYGTNDRLLLREWDPDAELYTGRQTMVAVTYCHPGNDLPGVDNDYVVMMIDTVKV